MPVGRSKSKKPKKLRKMLNREDAKGAKFGFGLKNNLNREGAKDAKGFFGLLLQVIHHPFYTVFQRFP